MNSEKDSDRTVFENGPGTGALVGVASLNVAGIVPCQMCDCRMLVGSFDIGFHLNNRHILGGIGILLLTAVIAMKRY